MVLAKYQDTGTGLGMPFSQGTSPCCEDVVFAAAFVRCRPRLPRDRILRVCLRCGYVDESTVRCRHVIGRLLVGVPGKCRDCAHHPAAGPGTTPWSAEQRTALAVRASGRPDSSPPAGCRPDGPPASAGCGARRALRSQAAPSGAGWRCQRRQGARRLGPHGPREHRRAGWVPAVRGVPVGPARTGSSTASPGPCAVPAAAVTSSSEEGPSVGALRGGLARGPSVARGGPSPAEITGSCCPLARDGVRVIRGVVVRDGSKYPWPAAARAVAGWAGRTRPAACDRLPAGRISAVGALLRHRLPDLLIRLPGHFLVMLPGLGRKEIREAFSRP